MSFMNNFNLAQMDSFTLLLLAAAGVIILYMVAMFAKEGFRDPMAARVKILNERREQLKAGITASRTKKRASVVHKSDTTDVIRKFLTRIKVLQDEQLKQFQVKLAQAGIRSKEMAVFVVLGRLLCPLVIGGIAFLGIYVFEIWAADWSPFKKFMAFAAALLIGYYAPDIYLKNQINKRLTAIRKGLPDALDLMVICAEAGLTVDTAFNRVSKELGRAYPELGDEFGLTAIELSFLNERRQAFLNLSERVGLDSVRGVVTTIIQTEKYGTPLASALRVLSAEFRNERMMRAEEKAARLPAIMTVPLILFILPTLFIVILGPAACSISDALINK